MHCIESPKRTPRNPAGDREKCTLYMFPLTPGRAGEFFALYIEIARPALYMQNCLLYTGIA